MLPNFGDKNAFAWICTLSEYFPSSLGFVFYVFFRVSLGHFVIVLFAFVVLGLVSSST